MNDESSLYCNRLQYDTSHFQNLVTIVPKNPVTSKGQTPARHGECEYISLASRQISGCDKVYDYRISKNFLSKIGILDDFHVKAIEKFRKKSFKGNNFNAEVTQKTRMEALGNFQVGAQVNFTVSKDAEPSPIQASLLNQL